MVEENLTDEQQADIVRQWLRENGLFVLGGIVLAFAILIGWDRWQLYRTHQAEDASGMFEELVDKVQAGNQSEANELLKKLAANDKGSPYVDQAHFELAKMSLDRNDFEAAASHLESVIAESGSEEMEYVARIRLAGVRLQQERYDDALKSLEGIDTESAFYTMANDIRGDIYVSMNRNKEALASYDAALTDNRQPPPIDRDFVQAKRDSLDVGESFIAEQSDIDTPNGTENAPDATE